MPKSPPRRPAKARICVDVEERFPSLKQWETWYEKSPDLTSLRSQAGMLRQVSDLISQSVDRYPEFVAERGYLEIDEDRLRNLVAGLDLDPDVSEQVLEDVRLTIDWYLLPQRRAALGLDTRQQIDAMRSAASKARQLRDTLSENLLGLEDLLPTLDDVRENETGDFDLRQFQSTLSAFLILAETAINAIKPGRGGRSSLTRRDYALAMLILAIEQAVGEQVRTSRADEVWRFTTRAGQFVRDVMRMLGWPDERVLVTVVQRISRVPRKKMA
ncbi:hypothetical protein [Sphingomonas sp. RS2018]